MCLTNFPQYQSLREDSDGIVPVARRSRGLSPSRSRALPGGQGDIPTQLDVAPEGESPRECPSTELSPDAIGENPDEAAPFGPTAAGTAELSKTRVSAWALWHVQVSSDDSRGTQRFSSADGVPALDAMKRSMNSSDGST